MARTTETERVLLELAAKPDYKPEPYVSGVPRIIAEHYGIEEPTFDEFKRDVLFGLMFGKPTTVDNGDGTFTHTWGTSDERTDTDRSIFTDDTFSY